MGDEFSSSINWWDPSRTTRFDGGGGVAASSTSSSTGGCFSSVSDDEQLHMMGLGLSSPAMEWNHALMRGEKGGEHEQDRQGSFRSMLQEDQGLSYGHHHQELRSGGGGGMGMWRERSSTRGFSLDQPPLHDFCSWGVFQAAPFGSRLMGSYTTSPYGNDLTSSPPNWSSNSNYKVPQFLRSNSPPKPSPQHQQQQSQLLHFSNNAQFWNAASAGTDSEVRPPSSGRFFPTSHRQRKQEHHQFPAASSFDDKPKNNIAGGEERNSSSVVVKKSEGGGGGTAAKRPRSETSTLPAFKVGKEKMGDRITALQQLVSPFGKTDTASVLSEAIECIKFLHDQISVLSTPYMQSSGAPIHPHHQQSRETKPKEKAEAEKDLRSRGLCMVPVSSAFPATHETTVDFWTPTFGGTFR